MNLMNVSAALMSLGLLIAAPAFAQTTQAKKQHTEEGAPAFGIDCSSVYNANPAGDPNCKQHTQDMVPPAGQPANSGK